MSEEGKTKQHESKVTNLICMGKEDRKTKHRSEKLSTTKSAKLKVDKCSKCKQVGHIIRQCPVIKVKRKSKKRLIDWNIIGSRPTTKRTNEYKAKIAW